MHGGGPAAQQPISGFLYFFIFLRGNSSLFTFILLIDTLISIGKSYSMLAYLITILALFPSTVNLSKFH
jgi:hypothetical protein